MTNQSYREGFHLVPSHMQPAITGYIEHHRSVGDFLFALLSNDLMGAFHRADDTNLANMLNWVKFLYNYAPQDCYGSPEKVTKWQST